ncbi:unnamed protein product [Linum tenue]|nr:unnamed protein product [Linum tenue]
MKEIHALSIKKAATP